MKVLWLLPIKILTRTDCTILTAPLLKSYQVVTTSNFLVIQWAIREVLLLQDGTISQLHLKTNSRSSVSLPFSKVLWLPRVQVHSLIFSMNVFWVSQSTIMTLMLLGSVVKVQRKIWYRLSIVVRSCCNSLSFWRLPGLIYHLILVFAHFHQSSYPRYVGVR
jgi:hypothetical protein